MSDIKTSKKQVGFLDYPTMNNSLENSMIVQKFSIQLIPQNIPRRSSISQDHSSIKTKHTLLPPIHHNKGRILSPINNNTREKLNNQKTIFNRSEDLNGTITIENQTEFHTTETEKKISENQETLNLLNKIKESPTAALIGPMPLSQQACRFELPFDLKLLENLTPLDYLSKYCRLSPRRKYQFKRLFDKYRNRQYIFESSYLYLSITDIHKEHFSHKKFDYLCQLINLDNQQYQFTFPTYAGILALCERILFKSLTLYEGYDDYYLTKDALEKCDFYSLDRKLDGLNINDSLKRLLNVL